MKHNVYTYTLTYIAIKIFMLSPLSAISPFHYTKLYSLLLLLIHYLPLFDNNAKGLYKLIYMLSPKRDRKY